MRDAIATLTESMVLIEESKGRLSDPILLLMQRGLIQAFEYNYGLALLMMTRYLREHASVPDKHDLNHFEELIRVADEHELLLSPISNRKAFRHARNLTSHTYHRAKAEAVASVIPDFEREVVYLLSKLQEKLSK
jgi:nucleotidyltransferase substrate binding protein (TIGR01987 family)